MSTCYEYIRKSHQDKELFNRLESYLKAIDDDKVDEYHDKHNHKVK